MICLQESPELFENSYDLVEGNFAKCDQYVVILRKHPSLIKFILRGESAK